MSTSLAIAAAPSQAGVAPARFRALPRASALRRNQERSRLVWVYGVVVDRAAYLLPERMEGDRVLLRRWCAADAEALARAVIESEQHLRPWMGWMKYEPQTLPQRRAMLSEREAE